MKLISMTDFVKGANYILNILKSKNNESENNNSLGF